MLRDLLVPLVGAFGRLESGARGHPACRVDCGNSLDAQLWLPSREQGFDPLAYRSVAAAAAADDDGDASPLPLGSATDVLVLTNNAYGGSLKSLSREAFLQTGCVLSEWLRRANGLSS